MSEKIATIKEVQALLPELSNATACRKIQLVRDALGKKKPKFVTITEFCNYFGINTTK